MPTKLDEINAKIKALEAKRKAETDALAQLKADAKAEEKAAKERLFGGLAVAIAPAIAKALVDLGLEMPEYGLSLLTAKDDSGDWPDGISCEVRLRLNKLRPSNAGGGHKSNGGNGGSRSNFSPKNAGVSHFILPVDGQDRQIGPSNAVLLSMLGIATYGSEGNGDSANRAIVRFAASDGRADKVTAMVGGAKVPVRKVIRSYLEKTSQSIPAGLQNA